MSGAHGSPWHAAILTMYGRASDVHLTPTGIQVGLDCTRTRVQFGKPTVIQHQFGFFFFFWTFSLKVCFLWGKSVKWFTFLFFLLWGSTVVLCRPAALLLQGLRPRSENRLGLTVKTLRSDQRRQPGAFRFLIRNVLWENTRSDSFVFACVFHQKLFSYCLV